MKSIYVIFGALAVIFAGACYLCCDNLLLSLAVLVAYLTGMLACIVPMFSAYSDKNRRAHECYRFIHSYLISLSATQSLDRSFFSAGEGCTGKLKLLMESIANMDAFERVDYMKSYFNSDLYQMFLSVLKLYMEQGGDVLALSNSFLEEVNRVEEANRQKEKVGAKNAFQYMTLWLMSLGVMVFLRFGMGNFFAQVKATPIYLASVGVFFAFMLFSFLVYAAQFAGGFSWKKPARKKKEDEL